MPSVTYEGKNPQSGVWEKIAETILSTNPIQFGFTNIPSGYKEFRLEIDVRSSTATACDLLLRFNGDTAANYSRMGLYINNGNITNITATVSDSSIQFDQLVTKSSLSFGYAEVLISNFGASQTKRVMSRFYFTSGTGAQDLWHYDKRGEWRNTSAEINSMTFTATQAFGAGSKFTLWGVR